MKITYQRIIFKKIFNVPLLISFMVDYKIYRSPSFQKEVLKYNKFFQDRIDKIENKLKSNPNYGNPLGTKWFRETRFEGYRVYYLVYENLKAVYMVAISSKKDQQRTINTLKLFLEFFSEEIKKLVEEDDT